MCNIMLHMLRKRFMKLIIVCYIIAELTTAMSDLPYKMTPFTSKAGDGQNEELLRKKQSLEAANENGNDENDENDENENHIGKSSRIGPKIWDQWGSWSSCSVTCGIGKLSRWRHCIAGGCSIGAKKAQLKTCTLAAC